MVIIKLGAVRTVMIFIMVVNELIHILKYRELYIRRGKNEVLLYN